jgi:Ser/Thr protein kinase RdoA (MazF antagonist)
MMRRLILSKAWLGRAVPRPPKRKPMGHSEPQSQRVFIEEIAGLCQRAWGLDRISAVVRLGQSPGSEALYRVIAGEGRFLFTVARPQFTRAEDWERRAETTAYLARHGFPTPVYRRTLEGKAALEVRGLLCTLRPWVEGATLERETLTAAQMAALGRTLGWCHRLLAALPPGEHFDWATGVPGVLEELDQLMARIVARLEPAEGDGVVLEALTMKRALLERAGDLSALFAPCPVQVVHGDYHVENVLFDEAGALRAVIDVQGSTNHRVLEVYRAIAWSQRSWEEPAAMDLPLAWTFVQGYREEAPLSAEELRRGPELLRWRLVCGLSNARQYVADPHDQDALAGIRWSAALVQWLGQHGRELGEELAQLGE